MIQTTNNQNVNQITDEYEYVCLELKDELNDEYRRLSLEDLKDLGLEDIGDIDLILLDERNSGIELLNNEIVELSEVMSYLSKLISEDGEKLDQADLNVKITECDVEDGLVDLNKANNFVNKTRALFRDIGIITGGVILGSIGLAGGPVIGVITLITSVTLSGGLVHGIRKHEKKHGTLTLRRVNNDKNDDNKVVNKNHQSSFLEQHFPKTYLKAQYYKFKIIERNYLYSIE